MRRTLGLTVAALLLLCLPMVGEGQSIRYHPDLSTLTLGKPTSASIRFHPAIASGSTLLTGLVSYWPLDEESGTRYDAVGGNDLTDNNTVGFDTGVDGAAASFVAANSESLSGTPVVLSDGWTVSVWAKPIADFPTGYVNVVRNLDGVGTSGYQSNPVLYRSPFSNNWYAYSGDVSAVVTFAPDGVSYIHFLLWYDSADGKVRLSLNGGSAAESTARTTLPVTSILDFGSGFDGPIDEVAIWDRVLTSDERAELYNAGAGKFYPF